METYYAYLSWCRDYNERNLIDPTSDNMEWHHTLPQCIFGDIRIGLWLTLRQHAIATALQTLAFNYNCLCGWHLKYLPGELLNLCNKLFIDANRKAASASGYAHSTDGARVRAKWLNEVFHQVRDPLGRSVHAMSTLHVDIEGRTAASRGGQLAGTVTGCYPWWVNPSGKTTRSPESPGPEWQRGRTYRG
jgi:hypothetical protein